MSDPQQPLFEDLTVEHHWFHVVRAMIVRGKIAEMGAYAWCVYCVLKAYTALDSGKTWPSQETIAGHIGMSIPTVERAIAKLVDMGIVQKQREGRRNVYQLMESIPMIEKTTGHILAYAERPYAPMQFAKFLEELKTLAADGTRPRDAAINITLNVNVIHQSGDNSTVVINNVGAPGEPGSVARDALEEIAARLRRLR